MYPPNYSGGYERAGNSQKREKMPLGKITTVTRNDGEPTWITHDVTSGWAPAAILEFVWDHVQRGWIYEKQDLNHPSRVIHYLRNDNGLKETFLIQYL